MRRASQSGVTLMELLISVTLLSLISLGILFALRVGLNAMDKTNRRFIANRRVAGAQRILEQQIANFMPVMAHCAVPEGPPQRAPFFQGEAQSMRFITSYSLEQAARGYARLVEFQVLPREDGRGVRLIVNDFLYTGPDGAGQLCLGYQPDPSGAAFLRFVPIQPGPHSFVLADRLAYCRFFYRETLPAPDYERWVQQWMTPQWPSAVRVDLALVEPGPAGLQVMSMTVPVRVNRQPGVPFATF
jgi:prepilin-type N-terminal cleavage/methylation domain-containing protein